MTRIIQKPKESEVVCRHCEATIGYTIIDIHHTRNEGVYSPHFNPSKYIECPACKESIFLKD